jgi:hypothetical protein
MGLTYCLMFLMPSETDEVMCRNCDEMLYTSVHMMIDVTQDASCAKIILVRLRQTRCSVLLMIGTYKRHAKHKAKLYKRLHFLVSRSAS